LSAKEEAQITNEKIGAVMGQVKNIHFVNVFVDSGTVHGLTLIHCITSNPLLIMYPVLFDLQKNLHFTLDNYASLFETNVLRSTKRKGTMLMQDPRRSNLVVSAFLIDNLRAQSSGFDLFLYNTPEHSAIIHIHCFTQIMNLAVSNPRTGGRL
jgi:hypothetical protein